ncbi:hypothetical protein [Wenjunlia tyrosinilytica]|uniref:Integral membrane protein n=1 Tax=Wenjunlia tyrosinilytica TaxID=1544741 RepID=A0A918DWY0_9ACTN|nr:hypothetical protein [Wenjunlia tyrosinilytica]GGO85596.1 hypothetical protein GCM10012280_19740 [Wenjunlia tyrosinilytica]
MSAKTQSTQDDPTPAGPASRPPTVTVAAAVAALEGAVLAAWAVYMMVEGVVGDPDDPMRAEVGGVAVLCIALMPLLASRGLLKVRGWSRGPVLVLQLLALPVAWTMAQNGGGMIAAGVGLGVVALVGAFTLIHPATTEALSGPRE